MRKIQILILSGEEEALSAIHFVEGVEVVRSRVLSQKDLQHENVSSAVEQALLFVNTTILSAFEALQQFCTDHLPAEANKIIADRLEKLKKV